MLAPPQLLELQREFMALMTAPQGLEQALHDIGRQELGWITSHPPLTVMERLDIYAEGYFLRLVKSLARCYPNCAAQLGEERFKEVVAHYYAQHPSHLPQIQETGCFLATFLKDFLPNEPWLAEWARWEWLLYTVLHTVETNPVVCSAQDLTAEQQQTAQVVVNPTLTMWSGEWALWDELQAPLAIAPLKIPSHGMIWKHHHYLNHVTISHSQFDLLSALLLDPVLAQACDNWSAQQSIEPSELSQWFAHWFQQGVLLGMSLQQKAA